VSGNGPGVRLRNVNEPRSHDIQLKDRLVQREDAPGNWFGVISTRAQDHRRDAARALALRAHVRQEIVCVHAAAIVS
jgi:hypothetical protein